MTNRPILLVEDNPDDELLTLRAFTKSSIVNPIVVARDGQEAIDYLMNPDKQVPAVILLDLQLPKLGGLEVLARLRADARVMLTPVVILTSSSEESDLKAGYKLGCNSYLVKPVDFDKFVVAVAQVGLYWLVLNDGPPVPRLATR